MELTSPRRLFTASVLAVTALVAALIGGVSPDAQTDTNIPSPTPTPSPSSTIDAAAMAQCRVDAVMRYMDDQGFSDDEYVVGEDRVDWDTPAVKEAGQAAFGDPITSREELAETFESSDSKIRLALERLEEMFPSYAEEGVLFDPANWEAVQVVGASQTPGNTGTLDGTIVEMGVRENSEGDGGWVFVDPASCTIPKAEVQSNDGDDQVGFIRFACTNPGDGLIPPPEPPPEESKDPALDPAPRGNAPEGGGRNQDPGPGEYIPEEEMDEPSSQPRENSDPPKDKKPPVNSTPEPKPEPIPEPEPSAPEPDDPAEGCSPAPGRSC